MKTLKSCSAAFAIALLVVAGCGKDEDSPTNNNPGGNPVTLTPCTTAPTATSNSPVTTGSSINLHVDTVANVIAYHWTGPNGFTSTQQNPVIASATLAHAGTYSVTATLTDSCTTPAGSVTVVVNQSTNPPCSPANNTMTNTSALPNVNFSSVYAAYNAANDAYTVTANGSFGGCTMIFGTTTQPVAGLYTVVNSVAFLQPDEVYLSITESNSFWGSGTGTVYVAINAGKITATFCDIHAYSNTWSAFSDFTAKIVQP